MEKNYKSNEDLLMFHQALRNWMCKHVAMIWIGGIENEKVRNLWLWCFGRWRRRV
jgi:cytosine/uracil/thiamine/allantoin permease